MIPSHHHHFSVAPDWSIVIRHGDDPDDHRKDHEKLPEMPQEPCGDKDCTQRRHDGPTVQLTA